MSHRAWVATRKGLFELRRARAGWGISSVAFLGEPVSAVLPPDPAEPGRPMIAALNLGHFGVKCHASDDAGRNWREVSAPLYPPQPRDSQDDVEWKLVQIWTLAGNGGTVWAGTLPGGLFRSDDGGASWRINEPLWTDPRRREWSGGGYDAPGIHSIVLDPRNLDPHKRDPARQRMLVGVSTGGAWASDDGGASWASSARGMRADYMPPEHAFDETAQDVHRIVACASSAAHLWCQHHNGIWRSTDAGGSWQQVTGVPVSDFGFTVAADPNDPSRAWFVPAVADQRRVPVGAALAVLRTDDGGHTFTALREGLPQAHCYDLVYRHGLDVGVDGRTLMMGSTTGGLWSSDDGGDHWQTVSTSLPPIHAVVLEPS
ncbi:MAG TPA: exo-alpha-sialidase [Burkholderiaceae bacterium]|nr:exo-alpha-sialidase [Burkholderiaceae bacterium]